MNNLNKIINKLYNQQDLTLEETSFSFNEIMSGKVPDIVISSFLTALKIKGETLNEILGATILFIANNIILQNIEIFTATL